MIYIVCVIHTMYLLRDGEEPFLSILLFEMPVMFFISGAAFCLASKGRKRSLGEILISRIKRVVVPFYIYAGIMMIIGTIYSFSRMCCSELPDIMNVRTYEIKDLFAILFFQDIPDYPYVYHLWFIVPYLIISCTFYFQEKIIQHFNRYAYLSICVILFITFSIITDNLLIRYVLAYNVFVVMGYLFYNKVSNYVKFITLFVSAIFMGGFLSCGDNTFIPMQLHKFPPDMVFCFYGILAISLLSIILRIVKIPRFAYLEIWNKRGYTIYLYQNLVFSIEIIIHKILLSYNTPLLMLFLIDASMVFILSTLLSYLFYPLEQSLMNKVSLLPNRQINAS